MKLLLAIGTLLLALPIQQTRPRASLTASECKCSIEVTVRRESNGEPISNVLITATFTPATSTGASPTPATPVVLTETTDKAGHAVFPNLAEGAYQIMAQGEGFFGPATNGNAPAQIVAILLVGPAPNNVNAQIGTMANATGNNIFVSNIGWQPVQHVAIRMIQGGVISGRVRDANRRPASGIQVAPYQITYLNGQRLMRQTTTAVLTDDLGEFRLFWFPPGEYYLRTVPQPAQTEREGGANFPIPTYHPGTMDLDQARPIVVREGQEVSGSDIDLPKSGGVTISGTIINTLAGRVNANGSVNPSINSIYLIRRNPLAREPFQAIPKTYPTGARNATIDATAFPFEIRGVPPGLYDFYPVFNDGATTQSNMYTGHVVVDVGSNNISGIQAAIQPGVDLKVHVTVIGTPPTLPNNRPAQQVAMQNMQVQVRPVDNLPSFLIRNNAASPPDPAGNITITNLPEARFFIPNLPALPVDAYIAEMRQGSRSILDDTIISVGKEALDPLEIVIGRGGGTVSGTVQDAQHKPRANVRVYLIPDPLRRRNLLLYKSATTSTMGTFNFQGVAPGAYKLVAWSDIPEGAEENEEFMKRYDALGTRVLVNEGIPLSSIQVHVIPENR